MRGSFEMKRDNGEVCLITRVMATDQSLTPAEIDRVVRGALVTAKHTLPGLLAAMSADQPSTEATTSATETVR